MPDIFNDLYGHDVNVVVKVIYEDENGKEELLEEKYHVPANQFESWFKKEEPQEQITFQMTPNESSMDRLNKVCKVLFFIIIGVGLFFTALGFLVSYLG